MGMLIIGLVIFVALHLIPCVPALRGALVSGLGANKYRGVFSLASIAGLVLIVWGFSNAEFQPVYNPPGWGRSLAFILVPLALILFASAKMPTHIRAFVRHPMILGLLLWAIAHLAANGDLRSLLLFGTLGVYAVIATMSSFTRDDNQSPDYSPRWAMDGVAVVLGVIVSGLIAKFHGNLFGMPLM